MSDTPEPKPLTGSEERLLSVARSLPPEALHRLVDELCTLVESPRCAESQADGVPCGSAHTSCERCDRFREFLARLRSDVDAG